MNMYSHTDIRKQKSCLCVRLYSALTHPVYLEQFNQLIKIAWPLIMSQVLEQFIFTLTTMYTGHLGKELLDAMALGSTASNIVAFSFSYGLNTACDTLFPQTYGSKNKTHLGILLQKAIVINIFMCIPVSATFFNMDYVFVLLGQDLVISKNAGRFMVHTIPTLFSNVLTLVLCKYLAHQNIVRPTMFILVLINLLHLPILQIFVVNFKLDLVGAAIAMNLSYTLGALLHVLYIYASGVYKATWTGWSLDSLQEWSGFLTLGMYGMMMSSLTWWSMEINIVLAGMLGKVELGGHYVCVATTNIFVMFSYGAALSVNVRVGNLIGNGDHVTARIVTLVGIALGFWCGIFAGSMFYVTGETILNFFTDEDDVMSSIRLLVPFLSVYLAADYIRSICGATILGIGRQRYRAFVALICVYCIALPLGVYLTFYRSMGLLGIWCGLCASQLFRLVWLVLKVWTIDWKQEAMLARLRTQCITEKCDYGEDVQRLLSETSESTENHDTPTPEVQSTGNMRRVLLCRLFTFLALLVALLASVILHVRLEDTIWRHSVNSNVTVV